MGHESCIVLSDFALTILGDRLNRLIGETELSHNQSCKYENDTITVPIRHAQHAYVKIVCNECFALILPNGRMIGHYIETWQFEFDSLTFIGLQGQVIGQFSGQSCVLVGENPNCRAELAIRGGQIYNIKKNYPWCVSATALQTLNSMFSHMIGETMSHFGIETANSSNYKPSGSGEQASIEDLSEDDETRMTMTTTTSDNLTTTTTTATSSSTTTISQNRSDREFIELLVKHKPQLFFNVIYYDNTYSLDRPDLETLISNTYDDEDDDGNDEEEEDDDEDAQPSLNATPNFLRCTGFFVYERNRGIWLPCSNITIEDLLVRALRMIPELTQNDLRYLGKNSNSITLRKVYTKYVERRGVELVRKSLNSINYFTLNNGLLVENGKHLRKIHVDDGVFCNCGWSYSTALAKSERQDLQQFLDQLFPLPEERRVVLEYLADLLDGHRRKKSFLVLTDRRQGNNGKSTFLKFLHIFFGEVYYAKSVKFLTASTRNDRNAHDAGLESMNGKRLLVADEFTQNVVLDTSMIKELVSVIDNPMQGRFFGKSASFKFIWQAGIIMAFNEGQYPQFDANDTPFLNRMIVCNMRSRFFFKSDYERYNDNEPYTYLANVDIVSKFQKWCSAFLDMLLEIRKNSNDNEYFDIPESMIDSRNDLIMDMRDSDGQLCEWMNCYLEENFHSSDIGETMDTGVNNETCVLYNVLELFNSYVRERSLKPRLHLDMLTRHLFQTRVESLCGSGAIKVNGIRGTFKRRFQSRKNGTNRQRRNVIVFNKINK